MTGYDPARTLYLDNSPAKLIIPHEIFKMLTGHISTEQRNYPHVDYRFATIDVVLQALLEAHRK